MIERRYRGRIRWRERKRRFNTGPRGKAVLSPPHPTEEPRMYIGIGTALLIIILLIILL